MKCDLRVPSVKCPFNVRNTQIIFSMQISSKTLKAKIGVNQANQGKNSMVSLLKMLELLQVVPLLKNHKVMESIRLEEISKIVWK